MITRAEKRDYFLRWFKSKIVHLPFIVMGLFIYPFIQRTKVRIKKDTNWYYKFLWYMLNDDELSNSKNYPFDFDLKMVQENKSFNLNTRFGRFKASYWFNALRNPAYNYSLSHFDHPDYDNYKIEEVVINTLETEKDGFLNRALNPMWLATWNWITRSGKVSNKGVYISEEESIRNRCKTWFRSRGIVHLRWSHAINYKFLWWTIYEEWKFGTFHNKYDITLKEYWLKNK